MYPLNVGLVPGAELSSVAAPERYLAGERATNT